MIYYEGQGAYKKITYRIFYKLPHKLKLLLDNKLIPLVNDICGTEMCLFKDKLNWKYGGGAGFKAHQDQPAWSDFKPKRFISLVFANATIRR